VCTVSVVPFGPSIPGFRLACNRDESLVRAAALPPRVREFGRRRAVLPIDPTGGGTWIAASDAGIVLALLNRNLGPPGGRRVPRSPRASRGSIIPGLLRCSSIDAMLERLAARVDPRAFLPFRLVLASRDEVAQVVSNGLMLRSRRAPLDAGPWMFTSSGLGDERVRRARGALFRRMLGEHETPLAAQAAFHAHRWPRRPAISVRMSRPRAETVSLTVVDLLPWSLRLTYHPEGAFRAGDPLATVRSLDCVPRGAREIARAIS